MSTEQAGGDFTRMLDTTVKALRAVGTPPAPTGDGEGDQPVPRVGEAAGGQVRAEFGEDGRLRTIRVEPRLMRLGSEELCAQIVNAVNAAIDAMRGAVPAPAPADLSQLTEQLEQVRDSAVPRLGEFLRALTDAQERLARGGTQ